MDLRLIIGGVLASLLAAAILMGILRGVSNFVSKLGVYHIGESFRRRILLLWFTYLVLSAPFFITGFILIGSQYESLDFWVLIKLAVGFSFIVPLAGRVTALAKTRPPRDVAEARTQAEAETLMQLSEVEEEEIIEDVKEALRIDFDSRAWRRENERILSFIFSLVSGVLVVLVLFISYRIYLNEQIKISEEIYQGLLPRDLFYTILIIGVAFPTFFALVGEGLLRILGIPDALKTPKPPDSD